jgi:H+/Cl- antiporter ClcA
VVLPTRSLSRGLLQSSSPLPSTRVVGTPSFQHGRTPDSTSHLQKWQSSSNQYRSRFYGLYSITSDSSVNDDSDEVPLTLAMAVGVITSLIGFLYAKCMGIGFKLLWKYIPSHVLRSTNPMFKLLQQYPASYILLTTTLGGLVVATLSTLYFPNLFSAHDFVHILSEKDDNGEKMAKFPDKARNHLMQVMTLSLLTSISGFSLGPEAPMVTAGGLAGVSLARKYAKSNNESTGNINKLEETLAYAGAAGTLTGFMNIPIAGPIFAMEMTSRSAGLSSSAAKNWSVGMAASLAGITFVRGLLVPNAGIGGHFTYASSAAVGAVTGREMLLVGLGCGVGGAVVGTCFHKTVGFLKSLIWSNKSSSTSTNCDKCIAILKKTLVAFTIGVLSLNYPQTMFWGEGSLQCMVDGQCTPFSATPHGIPSVMTQFAKVNPNLPFSSWTSALQVGTAKFFAIALASAGKFPGGVIFPLLSNGASLAHSLVASLGLSSYYLVPTMVMSFMASCLTSITRTPLATVMILAMTASGITPLSVMLPSVLLASYVSVWASEKLSKESFFSYSS